MMHYKSTIRYTVRDQLVRDKLYIGSLLTCRRCNVAVTEYYFDHPEISVKAILCKKCKLEINPPILSLREYSGYLWNITQDRFENDFPLESFWTCGWFLREHTTRSPIVRVPRQNKTNLYTLEHYGDMRCIRFVDYPFYYEGMTECITSKCRDEY